jgi:hypothetical protein
MFTFIFGLAAGLLVSRTRAGTTLYTMAAARIKLLPPVE